MRVFAQHGHQPSDKITRGLREGAMSGVIFSARCLPPEKTRERLDEIHGIHEGVEVLIDPEFFASRLYGTATSQLGHLEKWGYLRSLRRRDLVKSETVEKALRGVYDAVHEMPVTAHVAPNIYISQSFDSMEAGIALNFIERSKDLFSKGNLPVYATLAIDRRALLSPSDFLSFLNDLTALERRPDGFYILIGGGPITERSDTAQSEIMDANVIGSWMMLNFALSQNGFKVINGYADILTPFLAVAGASASATGWWSNLRTFSLGRYVRSGGGGGQLPIIRYLSKLLLNRIRKDELSFANLVPGILNGLPSDAYFEGDTSRTEEALQMWEALTSLNQEVLRGALQANLLTLHNLVSKAGAAYSTLSGFGISAGYETTAEYLDQLKGGIEVFNKLAEL